MSKPRYSANSRKGVGGRIKIEDKFPTLVHEMRSFIDSNGFAADRRRQHTTGNCGVHLHQIQKYLYNTIPGLKEHSISISTISRLMQAPDRRFRNAELYRGVVDAKARPPKRTTMVKPNQNDHYYSARTMYAMEQATEFGNNTAIYSVDNKNKVRIGEAIPAVDRRCENTRIFSTGDQPALPDHDFHVGGMKVQVAGYLKIDVPQTVSTRVDDKDRKHFTTSRRGQLTVINRSDIQTMSIAEHVNDLHKIIQDKSSDKPMITIVADNGPDFRPNSITNEVFYSRLFRICNLDSLVVCTFCPGHSSLNMIEHAWAPLTKKLAGVKLTDRVPGEETAPHEQKLNAEERTRKNKIVYNNALINIQKYFETDVTFCGYNILVETKLCDDMETPFDDYKRLYHVLTGSQTQLYSEENQDVLNELTFYKTHVERRVGLLHFTKCVGDNSDACQHCMSHPIRSDANEFMKLKQHSIPSPVPSETHPGSFKTYIEMTELVDGNGIKRHDQHMPEVRRLGEHGLDVCNHCKYYQFSSKSNQKEHMNKFHPKRQALRNLVPE